jgi:replicative DNA helicase
MDNGLIAERALIGSVLMDQSCFAHIANIINENHFYQKSNRDIWLLLQKMINEKIPIDYVSINDNVKKNRLDITSGFLTEIIETVPTSHHWKYYANIVKENYKNRQFTNACKKVITEIANNKDAKEQWKNLANTMPRLFADDQQPENIIDILTEIEAIEKGIRPWGKNWNYPPLDQTLGQFQPGSTHILGGRSSNGKTTLALQLADGWASRGTPILYRSLETNEKELIYRRLSRLSGVSLWNIKKGNVGDGWTDLAIAGEKIDSWKNNFIIKDKKNKTPDDVSLDIKIAHDLHGIKIFILDHWHRLSFPETRDTYLHRAEMGFEKIVGTCSDLGITAIILAQLNREGEKRETRNTIPIISDIRELSRLSEATDTVIFTHYPYKASQEEKDKNNLILRIAKSRDTKTGDVKVHYRPEIYLMGEIIQ